MLKEFGKKKDICLCTEILMHKLTLLEPIVSSEMFMFFRCGCLLSDFHSEHLDVKSVLTYLMMVYLSISTQTPPTPKSKSSTRSSTTVILRADSQELPSTVVQKPPMQVLPAEVRTASEQQPLEQYITEPQTAIPEQYPRQQQIVMPEQYPVEPTVVLTQGQYLTGRYPVTQSPCLPEEQVAAQTQYLAEQAQLTEQQAEALELMFAEQQAAAQRQYLGEQQPIDPIQYDTEKQTAAQRTMPQEQCLAAHQAAIQQTAAEAQHIVEQEAALQKQYATEPKTIVPEQLLTEQRSETSNEQSSMGPTDKILNQGLGEQQSVSAGQCPVEQQTMPSIQEVTDPKPTFTNHSLAERQPVVPEESASVQPDSDQRTLEQRSSEQSQIPSHPHQQHLEVLVSVLIVFVCP